MNYLTKICADSLRSFTLNNYGIKLKAAHAHELVSMLLGYKSNNARLADTRYSLSNLQQAQFIIFDPLSYNTNLIDQCLQDFQYNHLNALHLVECFRSTLHTEKCLSDKVHLSFREAATHIAKQHLHQRLKVFGISPFAMKWEMDTSIEHRDDSVLLIVDVSYYSYIGIRLKYSKYIILLPRVAANLDYGIPRVDETHYSGNAREIDFPADEIA